MTRFGIAIASLLFLFNGLYFLTGDNKLKIKTVDPPFLRGGNQWVDSVFKSLSPDEKIAQMFMVAAYSNKDKAHEDHISKLILENKIGGLIMMQGGIIRHSRLLNYFQSISKVPLLISMDAEWGVAMRLDSAPDFPRQMALGAIQNEKLIYQMGNEIGLQCKRLGIHVNFAPVIDVNNNPENPVINFRSFGENKLNVVRKSILYMNALQDNKIIAVGKHFPGHGDTDSDSHLTLPVIKHNKKRLDTLELYPFKQLIKNGLGGIMVAHLFIPALDSTPNIATTLSKKVVTNLLKDSLKFKGLIFTDALNMKGVSAFFKPEELALKSILAGNDILLFPENIPESINLIKEAIQKKEISQSEIDKRCKKILFAKYWAGLNKRQEINLENLYDDLNNSRVNLLKRKLIENSLTLIKNEKGLVPFYRLDTLKLASLAICESETNNFQETLKLYADVKTFSISGNNSLSEFNKLSDSLNNYNTIFISLHNTNNSPAKNFGISQQSIDFINKIAEKKKIVLAVFGNPYLLAKSFNTDKIKSILISYDDSEITRNLSAQLLFGGIPAKGILPVSISSKFKAGKGINQNLKIRFKYSIPEEIHANLKILARADSIINDAIKEGAFPGCQVFGVKDGIVFYNKAFGHHTYDTTQKVSIFDIYDLASITKVAATTTALMKLRDEGKFDPDKKVSDYLTYLDSTDKKDILAKEVLTHCAKLTPFCLFWSKTVLKGHKWKDEYYNTKFTERFSVQVAENLYITKDYKDSMYNQIARTKLLKKKEYKYSDLGMYWLQQIIEKQTKEKQNEFLFNNFYKPLGAYTLGYLPLIRFSKNRITPTENDTAFRKQLIQGYVHDPGAAMLGGVAGHAGLFSNANDLAKLFQMLLDKGKYGGRQYLKKETIDLFNSSPYVNKGNRRALGFDKPEPNKKKESPVFKCVSQKAFGHQGFTGTVVWADPQNNMLFVFLSNRVYPDAENKKIGKLAVRAKVQGIFYDALK